jgi:hypothetical protein
VVADHLLLPTASNQKSVYTEGQRQIQTAGYLDFAGSCMTAVKNRSSACRQLWTYLIDGLWKNERIFAWIALQGANQRFILVVKSSTLVIKERPTMSEMLNVSAMALSPPNLGGPTRCDRWRKLQGTKLGADHGVANII